MPVSLGPVGCSLVREPVHVRALGVPVTSLLSLAVVALLSGPRSTCPLLKASSFCREQGYQVGEACLTEAKLFFSVGSLVHGCFPF